MCVNLQYPDRRVPGIATAAAADEWHNQLVPPVVGVLVLWNLHVASGRLCNRAGKKSGTILEFFPRLAFPRKSSWWGYLDTTRARFFSLVGFFENRTSLTEIPRNACGMDRASASSSKPSWPHPLLFAV